MVDHYENAETETRKRIQDRGELFEARSKMNQYIRFASLDRDHQANPDRLGVRDNINAPTPEDRSFVKGFLEKTLPDLNQMGSWTFEKSFQAAGSNFYQRAVHLFTCHDAQNNVVKVMSLTRFLGSSTANIQLIT